MNALDPRDAATLAELQESPFEVAKREAAIENAFFGGVVEDEMPLSVTDFVSVETAFTSEHVQAFVDGDWNPMGAPRSYPVGHEDLVFVVPAGKRYVVHDLKTEEPLQSYGSLDESFIGAREWAIRIKAWADRKAPR